jgi:GntR family transcriptional regulator
MRANIPLYSKIENDLKNKIFSGKFKQGDLLPSEKELMDMYKVSRLTARAAVNRLATERLVVKIQGKGTFVASPQISYKMGSLYSMGEKILMNHYEIKTKVLVLKKIIPDKPIKSFLEILDNEKVIYLERIRYANETPFALIKSYLPYHYVPNLELLNLTDKSLYQTIEDFYHLQLHEAEEMIEAINADKITANLLEVKPGTPLLLNNRLTRLIDGNAIEYEIVQYRSDIYKYHNKLIVRRNSNF